MAEVVGAAEHPLLNAQVLSQLFKYIRDFKTLIHCRLVCKQWYKSTFEHWRPSIGAIKLGEATKTLIPQPSTSIAKQDDVLNPTGWNVHNFLQNCIHGKTTDNIPADSRQYFIHWKREPPIGYTLSKVNLKSDCDPIVRVYNSEVDPVPPKVLNFWKSVGSQITYIHFDHCVFQGDFQFLFEKMVVEMMPNLTSLKVSDCQLVPEKPYEYDSRLQIYVDEPGTFVENVKCNLNLKWIQITGQCPMCFYQLLIISPKLEEIVLSTRMDFKIKDYSAKYLVKTLGSTRFLLDGGSYELKKLDLMNIVLFTASKNWRLENYSLNLSVLQELSINLYVQDYQKDKEFKAENGDDVTFMFSPQGLLSTWNSPTLQILKLFRPPIFPTLNFNPFQSEALSLQELYLWGNFVKRLDFLWKMPYLQVLYLDFRCHDHLDKMEKLLFGSEVDNGLSVEENRNKFRELYKPEKSFEWEICRHETGKVLRMELLECLHLDVPFQSEWVNTMVKWMPNLTILEVVLDQKGFQTVCGWLTGLVELKLLYGSLINDHVLTGLPEEEGMPIMRARSLTALKNLKRFEMKEIICNVEQGRLGDKSVYEGFLKMDNLKSVSISVSEQMTTEAENALKKHVDNVEVIRQHLNNENKICCQLKTFYCDVLNSFSHV